jgi:tetratricopeptide (TPR) repeat protein
MDKYIQQKRFDKIIQVCDTELQTSPNDVDSLLYKSRALIATGKSDASIPFLNNVLKQTPDSTRALLTVATLYDRQPDAVPYLDRILELEPNHMEALRRRALQEIDDNNGVLNDQARSMLFRILDSGTSDEDETFDYYNKAIASDLLDLEQESLLWFDKILKINSKHAEALFGKGQILMRGDSQSALQAALCFDKLTKLLPNQPTFWFNLFQAWRKAGRVKEAQEAIERAVALDPDDEHLNMLKEKIHEKRPEPAKLTK